MSRIVFKKITLHIRKVCFHLLTLIWSIRAIFGTIINPTIWNTWAKTFRFIIVNPFTNPRFALKLIFTTFNYQIKSVYSRLPNRRHVHLFPSCDFSRSQKCCYVKRCRRDSVFVWTTLLNFGAFFIAQIVSQSHYLFWFHKIITKLGNY